MKISVVLGSGFGDEGKGKVTNYLSKSKPDSTIVVRFNGGHQAGHTVYHNNVRHVFSSFGSGTLNGTPTYWSKYCTMFPSALLMEYNDLIQKGATPVLYLDPMVMVTTPYDISVNRYEDGVTKHGTVGSGFGKTVERHETLEHSHRIFAKDLKCEWILRKKLQFLSNYYPKHEFIDVESFIVDCLNCGKLFLLKTEVDIFTNKRFKHFVFEGAQGILLDREHGIFPHVTRSSTTSKNVFEILDRVSKYRKKQKVEVYYLTRCYQTRHGNGPLFGEEHKLSLINNINETNITNEWQGEFRIAPFSFALLEYAINSDEIYHNSSVVKKTVVVSHLDQLSEITVTTVDGSLFIYWDKDEFLSMLGYNFPDMSILPSYSEIM